MFHFPPLFYLSLYLQVCYSVMVLLEKSVSPISPNTSGSRMDLMISLENEFSKARIAEWMVLLARDYISCISKSHCPEASHGKYIAGAPTESYAGPVYRVSIPWWFESDTALGYLQSISALCGAHMAMGQVGKCRECKPLRGSQQETESKKGANFFVLISSPCSGHTYSGCWLAPRSD